MAGGFDATGFGAGLLSGINNNIAEQNKMNNTITQYGKERAIDDSFKATDEARKQDAADRAAAAQHAGLVESTASIINDGGDPDTAALHIAHLYHTSNQDKPLNPNDLDNLQNMAYKARAHISAGANQQPAQSSLPTYTPAAATVSPTVTDQTNDAFRTKASDLAPPVGGTPDTANGISINAPAPKEGTTTQDVTSTPNTNPSGVPENHISPDGSIYNSRRNEAALVGINPALATQIRQIANGDLDPKIWTRNQEVLNSRLALVNQYDPDFQMSDFSARNKAKQDMTSGKSAVQLNALNTVAGHLGILASKASELNNGSVQPWNYVANSASTAFGGAAPGGFETAANAVSNELAKAYKSGVVSDSDIKEFRKVLGPSQSPAQFNENLSTVANLLDSKIQTMKDQYSTVMGPDAANHMQFEKPWARSILDTLESGAGKTDKVMVPSITVRHDGQPVQPGDLGTTKQPGQNGAPAQPAQPQQDPTAGLPHVKDPSDAMKMNLPPGSQVKLPDGRIGTVPQYEGYIPPGKKGA